MAKAKTKTRRVYVKAKRRNYSRKFTLPLAVIGGFMPLFVNSWNAWKSGGLTSLSREITADLTGYRIHSHTWVASDLMNGTIPIFLGLLVHKILGSGLGVNRALGRAGMPWIRI